MLLHYTCLGGTAVSSTKSHKVYHERIVPFEQMIDNTLVYMYMDNNLRIITDSLKTVNTLYLVLYII